MPFDQPNFIVDLDNFCLLRDDVGIGFVRPLTPADASLVATYLAAHDETLFIAGSGGMNLNDYPGRFKVGEQQLAIEWVRREPKPRPGEGELNVHRFVFGITPDGKCHGYDVTEEKPNVSEEQIGNHWSSWEDIFKSYSPAIFLDARDL